MRRPHWPELVPLASWTGGVLLALHFHEMYWRHRGCFNELGRCFVEEELVVYQEASGPVYGLFVLASLAGLLIQAVRLAARLAKG